MIWIADIFWSSGLIESGDGAKILVKHVIPQCLNSDQIESGPVETLGGETIEFVKQADGKLQIKSGTEIYNVTATDVKASNGIIHVVDGVFTWNTAIFFFLAAFNAAQIK